MVIVGRTKVPYNDLFILNKDELNSIIEGHEIDKRDDWERTRIAAYLAAGPYLKKGTQMQSLWPLPWDEGYQPKQIDPEQLKKDTLKAKERFAQLQKIKGNG
jgi:hypothetical protein